MKHTGYCSAFCNDKDSSGRNNEARRFELTQSKWLKKAGCRACKKWVLREQETQYLKCVCCITKKGLHTDHTTIFYYIHVQKIKCSMHLIPTSKVSDTQDLFLVVLFGRMSVSPGIMLPVDWKACKIQFLFNIFSPYFIFWKGGGGGSQKIRRNHINSLLRKKLNSEEQILIHS